ncbi:MAG: ABC transporter permease [Acidobacteriota bacterium]
MNWYEVFRLALDAIWAHKLRSFLTLLGIIIGVASITAVATVIEGFSKYVNEKVAVYGTGALTIEKAAFQGFADFEKFLRAIQRNPDLTTEDLQVLREQLTLADEVAAQDGSADDVRYGNMVITMVAIQGVTPNFNDLSTVELAQGRVIGPFDEENRRAVCILGADIAKELFPQSDAIGKTVKLGRNPYEVIGVAKPLGTFLGQSQDNYVQIPLSTFHKVYGERRSLTLYVRPRRGVPSELVEDEIRALLRMRHHLSPREEDDFSITSDPATQGVFTTLLATVSAVVLPITSISLVVGGIVIMNIMLVSVTERTREIGIRKSLGARRRDILRQFLAESALLSLIGGTVGLILAYLVMLVVSHFSGLPVALPLWAVALALVVSGSVGLFFGIYPASKAARLDPIQALRAD